MLPDLLMKTGLEASKHCNKNDALQNNDTFESTQNNFPKISSFSKFTDYLQTFQNKML